MYPNPSTLGTVVVLGHPRGRDSLTGALAEAYALGAEAAGCPVDFFDLSVLNFEPNVESQSPRQQALEPDIEALRQAIDVARHVVFVYPTWWGTMPALLKGLLDRLLLPGWAFAETAGGTGYEGLLRGKTAEILTTMDTPDLVYRWIYRAPGHNAMARATLGFCGMDVVRVTRFGSVRNSDAERRADWLERARALGGRLGSGPHGRLQLLWRGAGPWLQALRLQFYPMTFIAYWVGALAALGASDELNAGSFWLGYLALFLLEAATVFLNDVHDYESDRRNAYWGPFTGGSRVLVAGALRRRSLKLGAAGALGLGAVAAGLLFSALQAPAGAVLIPAVFTMLALGYTVPPLKLCHRGLGEIDVALTHSFLAILFGHVVQGGPVFEPEPYLLSLPLFLAILPAIILSGIPDRDADAEAGKRTLVVRLGIRAAFYLALAFTLLAVAATFWLRFGLGLDLLAGAPAIASAHALVLSILLVREARKAASARRIDAPMAVALLFILWFGLVPLINLLA